MAPAANTKPTAAPRFTPASTARKNSDCRAVGSVRFGSEKTLNRSPAAGAPSRPLTTSRLIRVALVAPSRPATAPASMPTGTAKTVRHGSRS